VNFGESARFMVVKKLSEENFLVKNLLTLENFELYDIVRFGVGSDFVLHEIAFIP